MKYLKTGFLVDHIKKIMNLYHPQILDYSNGGYYQNLDLHWQITEPEIRHIVSTTRFIINYSRAASMFRRTNYFDAAKHGLFYLEKIHWQPKIEGYARSIINNKPVEYTQYNYDWAFVLLAYAVALKAGMDEIKEYHERTYTLMDKTFWIEKDGLYADEANPEKELSEYRGQNSNMHACEALITSYEASGDRRCLDKAKEIAKNITTRLTKQTGGYIWEHYNADWTINWNYNKNNPKDPFRPWGFQPGHQTEWAKLLIILSRYDEEQWMLPTAEFLFRETLKRAWDEENGGIFYGLAPDNSVSDNEKYFWVQAETIAASALLGYKTKDPFYWEWYSRIWDYTWNNFIDHNYGGWFQKLSNTNQNISDKKAEAGAKCDYHTIGACFDILKII